MIWKQRQEERERKAGEANEAWRKRRAAEQKRQEERTRMWQKTADDEAKEFQERYANVNLPNYSFATEGSTYGASTSTCLHDGWWPKIQGRTACPKCYVSWNYLLQCPGCTMQACPKCQASIRPRIQRNANRRAPLRTSSPDYLDDY
jgi:hypothetical protein